MGTEGVVIVGAGLAGYGVAREFRKADPNAPLTVITSGDGAFYSKPMLSAAWANGKAPDQLAAKNASAMAAELQAVIRVGETAVAADPVAKTLTMADGSLIPFSRLVLAVGARPRALGVPVEAGVPAHSVNDLDGYRRLRADVPAGGHLLIIGAGLIGCEFAHDFAAAGHRVTLISAGPLPMPGLLPPGIAGGLKDALAPLGVEFVPGDRLLSLERTRTGLRAKLASGRALEADAALSAIGFDPDLGLARSLGLSIGRGIRVDASLRSSHTDVFALGDCAEMEGRWLPFVQPLTLAAKVLGRVLAGGSGALAFPPMPVVVKTPSYPIAVLPPPAGGEGVWDEETGAEGGVAVFRTASGRMAGFAAAGSRYGERASMLAAFQPATAVKATA
jgi:rubredoxin-NAD+ reductase